MGILLNDLEKLICKNEITIALRKTQVKPLALIRSKKSSHINHVAIQEDTKDPRGSSGDVAGGKTRGTLFQKEYVHFPCGGVLWKFGRKTLGKHVFSYHHLWRSHSCFGSALSPITVATNTPSCLMAWWRKKKRRVPGLAWDAEGSKRQTHGLYLHTVEQMYYLQFPWLLERLEWPKCLHGEEVLVAVCVLGSHNIAYQQEISQGHGKEWWSHTLQHQNHLKDWMRVEVEANQY